MATKQDLKARRVNASITRKQGAEAAGISQFKLDKIERDVDVGEDVRKAYDTGLAKLLAVAKKAPATNGSKPASKKSAARKAAQPKAGASA